tara:strand:- start:5294 stop:6085 length:792 start_codon:yes stop_codon:yes gene_type:complete
MSQAVDIFSKILQLPNVLTSGDSGLRGAKGPTGITVPVIAPSLPTDTVPDRELRTGVKEDKGYLYLFLNGAWKELEMEAVNEVVARPVLTSSTQLQITFWGTVENMNYENIEVFSGDQQVQSTSMSFTSSVLQWNAENPFTDDLRIVYPFNLPEDRVSYTEFVEGTLAMLPGSERTDLTITGTVTYIDISGGFYGVVGDDGSKYVVVNEALNDWDKQRVTITGYSTPDILTIFMWGKPIWATLQITEENVAEEEEDAGEDNVV